MHLMKPVSDKLHYHDGSGTHLHHIPRALESKHPEEYPSGEQLQGHVVHLDVEGKGAMFSAGLIGVTSAGIAVSLGGVTPSPCNYI